MASNFGDRMCQAVKAKGTPLVVGIDPVYSRLPVQIREHRAMNDENDIGAAIDAIFEFSTKVIRIVAPLVPAVKINIRVHQAIDKHKQQQMPVPEYPLPRRHAIHIIDQHPALEPFEPRQTRPLEQLTLHLGNNNMRPFPLTTRMDDDLAVAALADRMNMRSGVLERAKKKDPRESKDRSR